MSSLGSSRRRFADAAFAAEEDLEVHRWDDGVLDTDTARRVKLGQHGCFSSARRGRLDRVLRDFADFHQIQDPADWLALANALGWVLELLTQALNPAEISKRIRVGDNSTLLLTKAGVHLLSGHAGKGQQFDWVVVIGLEDGNVPFFEARSNKLYSKRHTSCQ